MKVLIYRTIRTEKTRPQMEFEALIGPDMTNSDVKRYYILIVCTVLLYQCTSSYKETNYPIL
jgi:hypothetical protein